MKVFHLAVLLLQLEFAAGKRFHLRHLATDKVYGDLRSDWDPDGCIKVRNQNPRDDQKLLFDECDDQTGKWRFDADGLIHSSLDDDKCIQAGRNGPVKDGERARMFGCDSNNKLQMFIYDGSRGGILSKSYPKFCMVWQGVNGNLGKDYIIFKECDKVEPRGRGFYSGSGFHTIEN
jgi:hypothetical protein